MDDAALDFSEAEAPDPALARAEWRLRLLEELTEIGMGLARGLRDEATGIAVGEKPSRDPAEVFVGISRAVRLTLALHAKADQELRDLKAGIVREREEKRVKAAERATETAEKVGRERRDRATWLVLDVIESESENEEDYHGLAEALDERMQEDPAYENCGEWPLREFVERLCRDLGLNPDWSHWTGEGWDGTYDHNPFSKSSRRPVVWNWEPSTQANSAAASDIRRQLE